jgi:hypothetical protein
MIDGAQMSGRVTTEPAGLTYWPYAAEGLRR